MDARTQKKTQTPNLFDVSTTLAFKITSDYIWSGLGITSWSILLSQSRENEKPAGEEFLLGAK